MRDAPENRSNLQRYYKFVKLCGRCKKPFGFDLDEPSYCPKCENRGNHFRKREKDLTAVKQWHRKKDRKPMEYSLESESENERLYREAKEKSKETGEYF